MSSHYRSGRGTSSHRPLPSDYQQDGRMYDDDDDYQDRDRLSYEDSHGSGRNQRRDSRDGEDDASEPGELHIRGRASSPYRGGGGAGGGGGGGRQGYRDRDRADYVSPSRLDYRRGSPSRDRYGSRNASYGADNDRRRPRTPDYGGPPSREVMLDGLPFDLREEDITYQLKKHYGINELKDVRVIRDRETKKSRGFGFIRFSVIEEAVDFVERYYPTIELDPRRETEDDRSQHVRIAFSRERQDRQRPPENDDEWTCISCSTLNFAGRKACFRCHAIPPEVPSYLDPQAQQQEHLVSGDSDAAMQGPPSQFLLIRGLEPNVTEELLSKGIAKLLKPPSSSSQAPGAIVKKAKVASTTGDANLGAREGSLKRVFLVRDRRSDESWRYGFAEFSSPDEATAALTRFNSFDRFTISSKPVNVSFIHTGVFVPVFDTQDGLQWSFTPYANQSLRLRYWNEHAYVKELLLVEHEFDSSATEERSDQRAAADAAAQAAATEGLVPPSEDQDAKAKKRKAEAKEKESSKAKKSTPAHLQFWSNRHAELHGIKQKAESDGNGRHLSEEGAGSEDTSPAPAPPPPPPPPQQAPPTQSYADPNKNCCYLCSRQFKSTVEVNKHERLSKLHQDNLQNKDLIKKAEAKLRKAGVTRTNVAEDATGPEYRDRAKERRQAFGPSKRISLPMKNSAPEQEDKKAEAAIPQQAGKSKGAALLGKMGWTSGEGLGARGEGTTSAIETNLYAAGVGLGAEGGKLGDAHEEAARNSRGDYKEFLQKAKDKAKERYESMS